LYTIIGIRKEIVQMKKRFSGPQIVAKLREADILLGQGKTVSGDCEVIRGVYAAWQIMPA